MGRVGSEEAMNLGKKTKGHGDEGCPGTSSVIAGQEGKAKDENKAGRPGRGRGRRGRVRGRQAGSQERSSPSPVGKRRGWKTLKHKVHEAERAYSEETNADIRRIIQDLEAAAMQEELDPEMEDWEYLLPDPGNTRDRLSLYKQALHVYWVMKRLLAKAMEQVAMEITEIAQGIPNVRKEMKNLQITLLMQDSKLEEIQQQLKKIVPGTKEEDNQHGNMVD